MAKQRGLGKGLDALFSDNSTADTNQTVSLKITEIEPNRDQPRKEFDEEALVQLADSIRTHGVIQPLLVRPNTNGTYQLVAGERRWRAARMAGLGEVPVVIREMENSEAAEIALVENLQREDLNAMEESLGYKELMERYGLTQDEVAKRIGKSRPAVANAVRLLGLPAEVQDMVKKGALSAGHARALLAFSSEKEMLEYAQAAANTGMTVRELERKAKTPRKKQEAAPKSGPVFPEDSYLKEMELALKNELNRSVKIQERGKKGIIEIEYFSRDELKDIVERLSGRTK